MIKALTPENNTESILHQSLNIDDINNPYFIELEYKNEEKVILDGKEIVDLFKERIDPYKNHSTLISKRRNLRPQPDIKDTEYIKVQSCLFDNLDEVAKPTIKYEEYGTYIAPNPFAFNPGFHSIVFTKDHIETIDQIEEKHIEGIFNVLQIKALEISKYPNINQLDMGMNFGTNKLKYTSGASQPHLHAQIGAVYNTGFMPQQDNIQNINDYYKNKGIDYEGLYLSAIKSSDLLIIENENFMAYTPFSPRFKDEVHIISKNMNIPNILSLDQNKLEDLSKLIYSILKGYQEMRVRSESGILTNVDIKSFNIEILGLRFDRLEGRMLINIIPRQTDIAYSELMGRFVIDREPENTANILRKAIKNE